MHGERSGDGEEEGQLEGNRRAAEDSEEAVGGMARDSGCFSV